MSPRPRALIAAVGTAALASCTVPTQPGAEAPYDVDEVESFLVALGACEPAAWSPFGATPILTTQIVEDAMFRRSTMIPYLDIASVRDCVRGAAGDCNAVMACFGYTAATSIAGDTCGYAAGCAGNVLQVSCQSGFFANPMSTTAFSAAYGQSCAVVGRACAAGAMSCADPCGATGWQCAPDGASSACLATGVTVTCPSYTECMPGTRECVPRDRQTCTSSTCDGSISWECVGGIRARRFDCGAVGMTCDAASGRCAPVASDCAPGSSTCAGSVLTYCGPDGHTRRYDCLAHGWASCAGSFCAASREWLVPP